MNALQCLTGKVDNKINNNNVCSYCSYCIKCLTTYINEAAADRGLRCAVCRKPFDKSSIRIARDVQTAIVNEVVTCKDCSRQVSHCCIV